MADETVIPQPVIPAPDPGSPPPEIPPPLPTSPAKPESRRETIARAVADELKKDTNRGKHAAFQPRQPEGQFAPGAPQPPPANGAAGPAVIPAMPQRPALPKSLKKELEAHWNTIPVPLAEAVHKRETEYEQAAQRWQSKAAEVDALLKEFQPYQWMLQNENATPATAVKSLLQSASILRTGTPAQKAMLVAQLLQTYGIPLEHIQQVRQGNGTPPQGAMDPQFSQVLTEVQQLKQTWIEREQQQQQQAEARLVSTITAFAADPKHPHFDAVADRMLSLLHAPQVLGDTAGMTEPEKLQLAYDTAVRLDPALAALIPAVTPVQVQNARSAAVQVHGAPGSAAAVAVDPKNRRAVIENAMRQASR